LKNQIGPGFGAARSCPDNYRDAGMGRLFKIAGNGNIRLMIEPDRTRLTGLQLYKIPLSEKEGVFFC